MQPSEEMALKKIYAVIPFLSENWKNAVTAKYLLYTATDILEERNPANSLAKAFGHMENGETVLGEVIGRLQKGKRCKT